MQRDAALAQRAARGRAGQPPGKLSKKTLAQRLRKLQRRTGARHSQSVAERAALAHAWNHARLRHGEQLHGGSTPVNSRQKNLAAPFHLDGPGHAQDGACLRGAAEPEATRRAAAAA